MGGEERGEISRATHKAAEDKESRRSNSGGKAAQIMSTVLLMLDVMMLFSYHIICKLDSPYSTV